MDYLDDKEEPKLSMQRKSKIASIICISFNQDKSWLACGTTLGFRVYDTQNMKMIDSNEGKNFSLNSGVCSISLLSKTILVSIVTDGLNAHHPNTIVYLWDKYTKEVKKEFKHTGKVETTYLIPKKLFTLSQNTIFVWDLETASIKELISTSSDLTTFFVNSLNKSSIALVHQNDKKRIVVVWLCINVIEISITNISAKVETIIKPEVPEFQIITLSDDLSYLALVDTTGIYVYVYDANSGKLVFEFIRGKTSCKVTWIQFSEGNQFLIMMNEKGTLHIFKLEERNRTRDSQENEGIFSTMALFVPKLFSKPSGFCRYHPNPEKLTGISWVDSLRGRVHGPFFNVQKDDNIKVFFVSGMYNTIKFNKNEGGECHEIPEASGKIWFDPFENEETPAEEEDDDEYIII